MKLFTLIFILLPLTNTFSMEYNPKSLFGEYPAKYHCIKVNRKIVKCNPPSMGQMDAIIFSYEEDLGNRLRRMIQFIGQFDPLVKDLSDIADNTENEIGNNSLSQLYRNYIQDLPVLLKKRVSKDLNLRNIDDPYDAISKLINNDSPYLAQLYKLKQLLQNLQSDLDYGDFIFSAEFKTKANEFIKVSEYLNSKLGLLSYPFGEYIPLDKSCLSVKGRGKFSNKEISLKGLTLSSYRQAFHPINDLTILKNLLTSNNTKSIQVKCIKVKKKRELLNPTYDQNSKILTIPYYIRRSFGRRAGELNFEFKKDIHYFKDGYFTEHLKQLLKRT